MNETVYDIEKDYSTDKSVLKYRKRVKEELPEEILCRICYCNENPIGNSKDLISPCGCKGTIKYVHRYCLKQWRFRGKLIKDIKVCEQCFCEYSVDDEKKSSGVLVSISTIAIILSLVLATNIFISSTADTLMFIARDISGMISGTKKESLAFGHPMILCNMSHVAAKHNKRSRPKSTKYVLHTMVDHSGREHYANMKRMGVYAFKNPGLLDLNDRMGIVSLSFVALVFILSVDNSSLLLLNLVLSFWRVLSFGKVFDWVIYSIILLYTYSKLFYYLYTYIDNYCTYIINAY
ncbi:hypothetical protein NEOKW01_1142 [Nematocida sp. AWRm80]|nr:hypothetical protein NEOKW01_1142 [Nematocida sp. AWRm80]